MEQRPAMGLVRCGVGKIFQSEDLLLPFSHTLDMLVIPPSLHN